MGRLFVSSKLKTQNFLVGRFFCPDLRFILSDIRLEANSGMYMNHTFSYRLDAAKLQMLCQIKPQVPRPSLKFVSVPMRAQLVVCSALIGPDTNFREGLRTWGLI